MPEKESRQGEKIKASEGPSRQLPDSFDKENTGLKGLSERHRASKD